ncbi:ABC transporter substrate-binding protein [Lacrimispora sp.]|uniref:ABC transporter substrate-binding protein n=1 Tax=Lacrimispora sp. TaxID=2719234 RepID=UPI00289F8EBD|nr:ABC transporter substrate-binding protein [Lacrimispora sp.]
MKRNLFSIILAAMLLLSMVGCGNNANTPSAQEPSQAAPSSDTATTDTATEKQNEARVITDLGGNQVEIPPVSEIDKIVIISPPVTSVALEAIPDKNMIVGLNPRAFAFSNPAIMAKLYPNIKDVDTTFIGDNFAVNTEALLKLEPDIILYYGEMQKKGVANIGLPIIDFYPTNITDPKDVATSWDNLLREIFGVDNSVGLETEWKTTEQKTAELLKNQTSETKSALCVFSNMGGSLVVSGNSATDTYAQNFFDKAGIRNVAEEIDGTAEVSMEQIYKWNPDMIIVFHNAPAKAILNNNIEGQDWSLLDAWKNKAVYDVPQSTYAWVTPCADSPLMPLWLISKAYPELYSEEALRQDIAAYYERLHKTTLTDEEITSILALREVKK